MDIGRVVLLVLPMLVGGIAQAVVIRTDAFAPLGRVPLDGGLTFGGRRLFGAHKTLRGAIVMILATAVGALVVFSIAPPYAPEPAYGWFGLGAAMGLGYIVAELPNSFVKRRLGVAPGEGRGRVQYVADQGDSVLGVLVVLALLTPVTTGELAALGLLGFVVHVLFDLGLHRTGVKQHPVSPGST